MSQFGNGHRGTAVVMLIAGVALLTLVGSQIAFSMYSSSSDVAYAETTDVLEEHALKALPTPTAAPKPAVFEAGIASTYGEGDGFEGNLTACGQVFHTNIIQVAHKSLPCGTTVRIEDTDTGRSVVARVTDRGPYITGRIVDLSWGAFKQLDPTGPGLLNVNVYIVEP